MDNSENFFCTIFKNNLFENKNFQLELILLENFSNFIRENMNIFLYTQMKA